MGTEGAAPLEEPAEGEPTPARAAASAILLRDGAEGLEVLLVQRNPDARFMGGAWVFPGGAVHEDDGGPPGAALRELEEEAGIRLGGTDELVPFSRWITPPEGAHSRPDGNECVDARWIRPGDALEAHERDELMLVFPTIKHLEQLAELRSVDQALEEARRRKVL